MRWKQTMDADAAARAEVQVTMKEHRTADKGEHAALSNQITEEHKTQTPEKMDALVSIQASFQQQLAAITAKADAAIAAANKAADDRVAAIRAENAAMPKAPLVDETTKWIGGLLAALAGAFFINKKLPSDSSIAGLAAVNRENASFDLGQAIAAAMGPPGTHQGNPNAVASAVSTAMNRMGTA